MPQYQAPNPYPDFAESGEALVSQPTPSLQASGFTLNQRPNAGNINWLFRQLGRSIRWLSQGVNASLIGAQQEFDFRLIGGGSYTWFATAGTLTWSDTAYVAMPGYADAANTIPAGSIALSTGQLAYVTANIPFSATGTTTSGSTTISSISFESGIAVGQLVQGLGIPSGASVTAISQADSSITLSKAATSSSANVSLIFGGGSANLTVQAASTVGFVPSATTVVIARCYAQNGAAAAIQLGVNAGVTRILDGESKALLGNGYVTTMRAVAGAAIVARQPVYISPGASDSRTAGSAYPLDVSASGTPTRATLAGVAASAVASGGMCEIVLSGRLAGFGTLTPGATYYASPTAPATLQVATPSAAGQYVVPVGTALSADVLAVNRTPGLSVAALGSTSVFAGPVSAPSFVSGAGFASYVPMGNVASATATAGREYNLQTSAFKDGSYAFYDAQHLCVRAGSIVALSFRSNTQALGNVKIYKNGTLFAQFGITSKAIQTRLPFTKGVQTFVADDVLLVSFTPSAAGDFHAEANLTLELSA